MHYHLLYGSTKLDYPENKEFFMDLEGAKKRLQELYEKYIKENPKTFFKKYDEDGPEHTIMFGEIPDAVSGSENMDRVVYGPQFKDSYMIALFPCDKESCRLKIN